ncbi:MAG: hypothetical protein KME49_31070 [Brasilonema octagenarum HA4186-MV1]|nr:hypothetical protein [Brasilonema octagenarum HA4186-MV1]
MYTQVIELPKIFNLTLPCRASLTPGAPSLGTPTPFGYACGTPRANASRLGRETLSEVATTRGTRARHFSLQRWSHQIPLSGNTHQVLAPQRTGSPY